MPEWELLDDGGVLKLRRVSRILRGRWRSRSRVGVIAADEGHRLWCRRSGAGAVWWWTHKIKGLHVNDFIMAAKTDGF